MSENLLKKWLVAQIKPNSYDLAFRNLKRQGFEVFIPKMNITIRKEKKFINKDSYLFPGYLFVGVDKQSFNWTKIQSTYGVSKLLVFNNKPSEISHDIIMALKNRYEANIDLSLKENLKKGDIIKFNSGPFSDLIAKIEGVSDKNRIYVLLEVMGGRRKLKVNLKEKINFAKV